MAKFLLPLLLIVITDPYKNIQYDKINVYIINQVESTITVHERDDYYYEELEYQTEELGYYEADTTPIIEPDVLPVDQYYNTGIDHEFYYFQRLFDYKK